MTTANNLSKDPFYITTPIYYVNAKPHLGHAYTTVAADVARRFHTMIGVETYFLTGTDEHGDKIAEAAEKNNTSPQAYADEISALFKDLWPHLGIENDYFVRTTDQAHKTVVKQVLSHIYAQGDIYYAEYEGLYCVGCERFYQERELVDGKCPDHQKAPETVKESNYFFKMSKYQTWLIDHIHENPDFIRPRQYRNEVLSFLKEPLEDLCISRPKTRLTWGIDLPFDDQYVTYVWFDALLNYVSALGYPDDERYAKFWPHAQHIIAKDILKTHAVYWPTMLKAAGIPVFKHLNVHGFWNMGESKMSKSLGNVANPLDLKEKYGAEAYRFFLMKDMVFGLDSNFSEQGLISRINTDLANDLGNLFSRTVAMSFKYFDGVVPGSDRDTEQALSLSLKPFAEAAIDEYEKQMAIFAFHNGLGAVWHFISQLNKYIDEKAPWTLAKDDDRLPELKTVMYNLLESLRVVSGLIYPVMPETALKMQDHLGLGEDDKGVDLFRLRHWGTLKPGSSLTTVQALFPRIDVKKEKQPQKPAKKLKPALKPEISIDDFAAVDLRVATIIKAEAIPEANKLLKITADIGEETPRTIVAGISKYYDPNALAGKQVIIVANLKPVKLMGIESQGMILAASEKKQLTIAGFEGEIKSGTTVK